MIFNKRNKVKELVKMEGINKMEIASDLINTAVIIKIKNNEVFRNVSFSQVEKEKDKDEDKNKAKDKDKEEEEEEKNNRGIIINENENENENEYERKNDNNEENILPSIPTKDLTNIKEEKLSSSCSEYHVMKIQMEKDKKVNEKVILAFDQNEFKELASMILQNTFRNLFSEVLHGEFSLLLPSSRMESDP